MGNFDNSCENRFFRLVQMYRNSSYGFDEFDKNFELQNGFSYFETLQSCMEDLLKEIGSNLKSFYLKHNPSQERKIYLEELKTRLLTVTNSFSFLKYVIPNNDWENLCNVDKSVIDSLAIDIEKKRIVYGAGLITQSVKEILDFIDTKLNFEFGDEKKDSYIKTPKNINVNFFKNEALPEFILKLKPYFSEKQHDFLENLLKTGKNLHGEHLIFFGNARQLVTAFKKAFKNNYITGFKYQKDLEGWICENFKYEEKLEIKSFELSSVNKTMSRTEYDSKNPIY